MTRRSSQRRAAAPLPLLPPPTVPVHVRFRQLRRDRRLSQMMLAELSGLNQGTISRLEAGTLQFPQPRTIRCLAQVYGMTEAQLRRVVGMHGTAVQAEELPWSQQAQQLAAQFDRLSAAQQAYITALITQWLLAPAVEVSHGERRP